VSSRFCSVDSSSSGADDEITKFVDSGASDLAAESPQERGNECSDGRDAIEE
jgi:hypothetical protein